MFPDKLLKSQIRLPQRDFNKDKFYFEFDHSSFVVATDFFLDNCRDLLEVSAFPNLRLIAFAITLDILFSAKNPQTKKIVV